MIVTKSISFIKVLQWSGHHVIWLTALMAAVAALYHFEILTIAIPWLPLSVIGTAVAFYVGFKNNQAYDRMWEARKIWGGIINDSRSWGMMVDGFITNLFAENKVSEAQLQSVKRRLIYRHLAWLYAHRSQLLVATPWEHASQTGAVGRTAEYYQKKFGVGLIDDDVTRRELRQFLPPEEHDRLIHYANTATQIIVVGDYSENPFQGMANDIPMLSLCRTIEIDLREMLGETELPPPIQAKNGILM